MSQSYIDDNYIARATDLAIREGNESIAQALSFVTDAEHQKRIASQQCKRCYYLRGGGLAGQAFTARACGICNNEVMYSSTHTRPVCAHCAQQNALCIECAGDIEMIQKRVNLPLRKRFKIPKVDIKAEL